MRLQRTDARIVNSQLINHNGYYTMDFEDIEEKAKRLDVTVFALCSPQNPTGRVWTEKELRRLADICGRNHVVLVSDEVHCEIVRKGVKFLTAGKVGKQDNTIVLNAINKTFNCAGLGAAMRLSRMIRLEVSFKKIWREVCRIHLRSLP